MTNIALVIIGWTLVANHVKQFRSMESNGTEYVNNVYAIQEAPVIGHERDGRTGHKDGHGDSGAKPEPPVHQRGPVQKR